MDIRDPEIALPPLKDLASSGESLSFTVLGFCDISLKGILLDCWIEIVIIYFSYYICDGTSFPF